MTGKTAAAAFVTPDVVMKRAQLMRVKVRARWQGGAFARAAGR
jgi:hypothetical protein